MITIKYGNDIVHGQKLSTHIVKDLPIIIVESNVKKWYTLIMIDPDALLPDYLQWLVINNSYVVITYEPPMTSKHRYVFYLYEQEGEFDYDTYDNINRNGFVINKFTKDNNLTYITNTYFTL